MTYEQSPFKNEGRENSGALNQKKVLNYKPLLDIIDMILYIK